MRVVQYRKREEIRVREAAEKKAEEGVTWLDSVSIAVLIENGLSDFEAYERASWRRISPFANPTISISF